MKHPGLSLCGPVEAIGDKGVLGRFEKLLNLSAREFPPKSGFFLWVEVSFLPIASCLGYQLDMPVMQRSEQLAENIEELIITGLPRDFWSVGPKLFFPVDIPQFESLGVTVGQQIAGAIAGTESVSQALQASQSAASAYTPAELSGS